MTSDYKTPVSTKPATLDWGFFLLLIAVGILAAGIRICFINAHALWMDESLQIWYALPNRSWKEVMEHAALVSQPSASYFALHAVMKMFGITEWAVKLPELTASVLSVVLIGVLGAQLANRRVGMAAAVMLTLCPYGIYYSLEVRMYSLLCFATLLYVMAVWACMARLCWSNIVFLLVATLLGFGTNMFFLFVVFFTSAALGLTYVFQLKRWRTLASLGCVLGLCLAIVFFWYRYLGLIGQMNNSSYTSQGALGVFSLKQVLLDTLQDFFCIRYYFTYDRWIAYGVLGMVPLAFLFNVRRHYFLKWLVAVFIAGIVMQGWIFSKRTGVSFKSRYVIYAMPFAILGCSYVIACLSDYLVTGSAWLVNRLRRSKCSVANAQNKIMLWISAILTVGASVGLMAWTGFPSAKIAYGNNFDKAPWALVWQRVRDISTQRRVYLVATVLYDQSPWLYFTHFRPLSNVFLVAEEELKSHATEVLAGEATMVILRDRNKASLDEALFSKTPVDMGHPPIDMWIYRGQEMIPVTNHIEQLVSYFGTKFRNMIEHIDRLPSNEVNFISIMEVCKPSERFSIVKENMTSDGTPLVIAGIPYLRGITIRPTSSCAEGIIRFVIGGKYGRFRTTLALTNPEGNTLVRVRGDGRELANSGLLTSNTPPLTLSICVSNINIIDIIVEPLGSEINDEIVLGNPRVSP